MRLTARMSRHCGGILLLFGLIVGLFCGQRGVASDDAALDARISRLIRELGADQFMVRERAQKELERIGVAAFDALDDAKDDDDVEVALRVRSLLRVISVSWALEDDPPEVKNALKSYGDLSELDRKTRMERLAEFGHPRAIAALCRLACFESNHLLGKEAALLVMKSSSPPTADELVALAKSIESTSGASRRPVAKWLRQYARTLVRGPSTMSDWDRLVKAEIDDLHSAAPHTNATIVRDLLRWQCDQLRQFGQSSDAEEVARRMVDLAESSPVELAETVGWLMDREYWNAIARLTERHASDFEKSAILQYRRAESLRRKGDLANADKIAMQAAALVQGTATSHQDLAMDLRDRGLYEWAEREFRVAISLEAESDPDNMRARYLLGEMLWDIQKPLEAARLWQEFVDKLDKDAQARERFAERRQFFRSRMHYFYAQDHAKRQEWDKVREQLELGIRHDPTDADVLIAMFRFPKADDAWKLKANSLIDDAAAQFLDLARKWEQIADQQLPPDQQQEVASNLATACNQYAWLVGNTRGDFDEAIRRSHRSVELMPKTASYLDTLAHCYFGKRDYANAVKYQSLAAKREPYTQQIQRQLEVFRAALEGTRR